MPNSSSAPPKTLTVVPATVEVHANAACKFTVDPVTDVVWTRQPDIGEIDTNGIYKSPAEVKMPQTVIVTATAKADGLSGTASIDLADSPWNIKFLGWYAIVIAVLVGVALLVTWSLLYQHANQPLVAVNPPIVTLNPKVDKSFKFTAIVLGDNNNSVTWSVDDGGEIDSNGNLQLKLSGDLDKIDKVLKVSARSAADSSQVGMAVVHLISDKHLEIVPSVTSAFPGQQVPLRTPNEQAKWSVSRSDVASITDDGVFNAGLPKETSLVQVKAQGGADHQQAALVVVISVPFRPADSRNWILLLFVIICGILGSMVYYTSSLVAYVGNRTFRSSWFWFYVSRPFVGGALAIIFFFLFLSGMISGLSPSNLAAIGLISALVGLFSDKAVQKLRDVIDAILTTKDERKDKIADSKPAASTNPAAPAPAAKSVSPAPPTITTAKTSAPATANQDTTVQVTGSNFKQSGLKVTANGQPITPTDATDQSFKLLIPAAQVKAPKITITVTTDQGSASSDIPVS